MNCPNKTILVIDDEPALRDLLKFILGAEGFRVLTAATGKSGMMLVEGEKPDLILLDLMLPDISGLDICRKLREQRNHTPIVMLTARASEAEKVIGLSLGANDYITKPFSNLEVIARVKAQLQGVERLRASQRAPEVLTLGNVVIDLAGRLVRIGLDEIPLRHKEFELLRVFATNLNRVLDREDLVAQVWGEEYEGDNRVVDVQICRLKEKLRKFPSCALEIQAIRFVGYRCVLKGAMPPKGNRRAPIHALVPATPAEEFQPLIPALRKELTAGHRLLFLGSPADFQRLQEVLVSTEGSSMDRVTPRREGDGSGAALEEWLATLTEHIVRTEAEGWCGTTIVVDTLYLLSGAGPAGPLRRTLSLERLLAHEAVMEQLQRTATRCPLVLYCVYDPAVLSGEAVLSLLQEHPWVLQQGRLAHNSLHPARPIRESRPLAPPPAGQQVDRSWSRPGGEAVALADERAER